MPKIMAKWTDLPTAELINEYALADKLIAEMADRRDRIEFALLEKMRQDGALEAVSDTHRATSKTSVMYDQSRLHAVLEVLPESELVDAGAYVPEHEETRTVRAVFNMTKLKPFGKRGQEVRDTIEGAKRDGATRLSVKPL